MNVIDSTDWTIEDTSAQVKWGNVLEYLSECIDCYIAGNVYDNPELLEVTQNE